ncbi:hypothetical protein KNP414_00657 [Paenibacillus mucilaginosus KNP414]|uniref:Uncharacterized protein n=1 Tax=Paenibacillus mucilaginosus (strain KNP414) TaxID=1036673 RepID=F8FQS6_PAEMK|nr:hypothetical protein KNP414_00657 [Paenibacillus mucilaginosus KNP414]
MWSDSSWNGFTSSTIIPHGPGRENMEKGADLCPFIDLLVHSL